MMRLVLQTGDPDLINQALAFLERHAGRLQVA
jgi:hypothetical protein